MTGMTTVNAIGLSGLRTAQAGMTSTANNVAGAAVDGFHRRQIHPLIASPTSDPLIQGGAVMIDAVVRGYSSLATEQYFANHSKLLQSSTLAKSSLVVDKMLVDEAEALTKVLNGFFTAAADVSADPASVTVRAAFATTSRETADRIRSLAEVVQETRNQAHLEMDRVVMEANEKSAALARVNMLIQGSSAFGKPTPSADLLDERDRLASQLADLVGAKAYVSDKGQAVLRFDGLTLVDGVQSFTMKVEKNEGVPTGVVSLSRRDLGDQTVFGAAQGGEDVLGQFGGLTRYADSALNWLKKLDQVAEQLVSLTSSPSGEVWTTKPNADGESEVIAGMFEIGINEVGQKALSLKSTLDNAMKVPWASDAIETSPPHQSLFIDLADQRTPVLQGWASWVTDVSSDMSNWRAEEASFSAVDKALNEQLQQVSGVDLDEEATNLLRFQQLYQANSSVMQAAMKMFDVLIGISR
jgi:flagellar hook-associated protein 1 FlgK